MLEPQSVDDWLPSENDPDADDVDIVAVESLFNMINSGQ